MRQGCIKVLFYLLKTRLLKNGDAPIMMRITVDGCRVNQRTGKSIHPNKWNHKTGRPTGKDPVSKEITFYLDGIFSRITAIHRTLEEQGSSYNSQTILNLFNGDHSEGFLLKQFQKHNRQYRELVGKEYVEKTVQRWERTELYLAEFIKLEYGLDDMPLMRIDLQFIKDFEHYLKVNKRNSKNSAVKYLENLKKIVTNAYHNNLIRTNPFTGYKMGKVKTKRVPLNELELLQVMNTPIENERLEIIRDCFVFCSFTGLSFSDAADLRSENIILDKNGQYWININRKKTDSLSRIPLIDIPFAIINKYKGHIKCKSKGVLLPFPSNQRYNSYLKEISVICHINKNLTSHVARHTFATLALENRVSLEVVKNMLGHEDIKTTTIYAHVLDSTISNEMKGMKEKFDFSLPQQSSF